MVKTKSNGSYPLQELLIAAVMSQDPIMMKTFTEPETKTLPDGTPYPNPWADMHTLTAKNCCFPKDYIDVPEFQWVKVAKEVPKGKTKKRRDNGKITNFG